MKSVSNTEIQTDRISIQVALSGYSFKVESRDGGVYSSGWLTADKMFVTPEFQKRYDSVDISLFTPKTVLFPMSFYSDHVARKLLSDVVPLSDSDVVESVALPALGAVMVYSNSIGETLSRAISSNVLRTDGYKPVVFPEMYHMLKSMELISEYNKIVASYADGRLYLAVAQGKTLMLSNSFSAADFTTAQYFIFKVMKKLQLNPEISSIYFRTPLQDEQQMSLYRYFSSVEQI